MRKSVVFVLCVVVALTVSGLSAEQMFMSSLGMSSVALKKCDTLHHEQTCDRYHVAKDPQPIEPNQVLTLNDRQFRVSWAGQGFRLHNGTVVAQSNNQWLQVFPNVEPVAGTVNWKDSDGDSSVSIADTVEINGVSSTVKEVRYYLWVEPIR